MTEISEFERLAEHDGATFTASGMGTWSAMDRHGLMVVRGAMSIAEAARLYCEDKGLTPSTPDAILARIVREYRPYDTMPEFGEGFADHQAHRRHENYDDVKAQAYDRGANCAMLYARALAHLDTHKEDVEKAGPGWLATLLRTGRC
jgi:hypothetical protein